MFKFIIEFCNNTTVHGVRYLTERKRHWSERIWWLIALGLSVWLCFSSIQTIWDNWTKNPITITFTEREIPISAIPFPTFTVCPRVKITYDKFDEVLAPIRKNKTISTQSDVFHQLCVSFVKNSISIGDKYANDSFYDVMEYLAPYQNKTFFCDNGKYFPYNYSNVFAPVFTDGGYCFAFNAINSHEMYTELVIPKLKTVIGNPNISHWSLDDGYDGKKMNPKEYPFRVFHSKSYRAMTIYLFTVKEDTRLSCFGAKRGYQILLTVPGEAIKAAHLPFNIPNNGRIMMRIKPKLIFTSDGLRGYTPDQRQCFFDSERRLRFFRMYTQNSCEAECLANFTQLECGCVKFLMPRDANTKLCGVGNAPCYTDAEIKLFGDDIVDGMTDQTAKRFRENCNCLPSCTTITYDVDIENDGTGYQTEHSMTTLSQMIVLFREPKIMALQRSALYTFTDFLAICGGLLGLFLGVSLLSIVEFAYYITLRLFWSIRQSKSENAVVPFQQKPNNCIAIDIFND